MRRPKATPKPVFAWALWVPEYGKWCPVGLKDKPTLYRTRAEATRHRLKGHDRVVKVRIEPLPPRCGCGLIDDVGVTCRRHTPTLVNP